MARLNNRQIWLLAWLILPLLLQALLVGVSVALNGTGRRVAASGIAPLLVGFVCLEHELRLRAAWVALLYIPGMYWLLAMLSLLLLEVVYGYSI